MVTCWPAASVKVLVVGLVVLAPEPPALEPPAPEPPALGPPALGRPPEPHPAAISDIAVTASAAVRPRRLPRLTCTESSPSRIVASRLEGRTRRWAQCDIGSHSVTSASSEAALQPGF